MFSLCAIAACEQCASEIMRAGLVSSSVTLTYCQSIRHMPLGSRRGVRVIVIQVICPPPARRPESIRVIASRPGLILCWLHRTCYTCSSTRCLLHFICTYITVYICLFSLSCFNPISCNSFYERTFITKYGLFYFYDLYALYYWYWLHFYPMYSSEMTKWRCSINKRQITYNIRICFKLRHRRHWPHNANIQNSSHYGIMARYAKHYVNFQNDGTCFRIRDQRFFMSGRVCFIADKGLIVRFANFPMRKIII